MEMIGDKSKIETENVKKIENKIRRNKYGEMSWKIIKLKVELQPEIVFKRI